MSNMECMRKSSTSVQNSAAYTQWTGSQFSHTQSTLITQVSVGMTYKSDFSEFFFCEYHAHPLNSYLLVAGHADRNGSGDESTVEFPIMTGDTPGALEICEVDNGDIIKPDVCLAYNVELCFMPDQGGRKVGMGGLPGMAVDLINLRDATAGSNLKCKVILIIHSLL